MRAAVVLLISVVALSLLRPARCQPPPGGVVGRAPPPIAQVIEGAPPLPVVQPQDGLEKDLRSVSDKLTAELQKKYGFCMADAYVAY
jgi:hypothetical protein